MSYVQRSNEEIIDLLVLVGEKMGPNPGDSPEAEAVMKTLLWLIGASDEKPLDL